ncbi:MAG: SPASM domain-containing protein [bacterium]|nr:SPASM domain-containing protein [bacterium]
MGNILKDGLFKIWYTSDVLWRIRDKNNLKGKCKGCKYIYSCGGCRAVAYAMTGDYMEEDTQCWK